ncbi:uncharacterized protein LOC141719125 [Apium graveolens]|uniref:uncharacterized protein LOC141719125 n=1 Tax=Apium graveolens TaxID=4045 RepID=UPI003D79C945
MGASKMRGGLRFRNLYGFNIAMLGKKQVWNLIYQPNSLVARVFKAKYYPNGNILNATRTGGSSFIWSGLWKAKEELKNDFRWVVGDGKTINVFSDPWLQRKQTRSVEARDYSLSSNTKVRIPQYDVCDRVAWTNSKEGMYTVKSGYQTWCEFATQCWQQLGLQDNREEVEDASEWLLDKMSSESVEKLCTIAVILWGIWFFRNKKVWENRVVSSKFAMDWSLKQITYWRKANGRVLQSRSKVGWVLRDRAGEFKGGQVMRFSGEASVLEAEAIGINETLFWLNDRTCAPICMESDSLIAVQAINKGTQYQLKLGHIFDECRRKIAARGGLILKHVRRLANRTAYMVARFPCEVNSYVNFMSPPRQVLDSIMYDASSE